jgi:heme/copper-type cytochrome/quinol oxidase subunit 2
MAKTDKGFKHSHIFILVLSIFILHIILAYLVAICTNYLLIKYRFSQEDLFQVNTMSHTFVTIIDVMLIAAVLKYFL